MSVPDWIQGGTSSSIMDDPAMPWSLCPVMDMCPPTINRTRQPNTYLTMTTAVGWAPTIACRKSPCIHYLVHGNLASGSLWWSKCFDMSILDWMWVGTLSLIMDDPTIAWSLRPIMDMCCLAVSYTRHPTPTSPLLRLARLGAHYNLWKGSLHPLPSS
jgi:hypothetical protein